MLFDGRAFASEIERALFTKNGTLQKKPRLVSVLVGHNPASELYTRLKSEAAARCGIDFIVEKIEDASDEQLATRVREIGDKKDVTGVMVQMPIPGLSRSKEREVLEAIPITKDVDGLRWEESGVMPATVRAILLILKNIAGNGNGQAWGDFWKQRFVVVGRGSVGRPLVYFLAKEYGAHATVVHSKTENIGEVIRGGEVVISCVGKPALVTEKMITEGCVAVDVGISQTKDERRKTIVVGDMTRGVYQKAAVAVPVPGGVGPVTVASLMQNALDMVQ